MSVLEVLFAVIFSVDVLVNIVANWWRPFFRDLYNYLDLFVVATSWVEHLASYGPAQGDRSDLSATISMRVLRVLRLARVLRLSRVFPDLKIVLAAISSSLSGITVAVGLLLLVTVLGAIIATSIFSSTNPDLFGKFSVSMFTMWSIGMGPAAAFDIATSMMNPLAEGEVAETADTTHNFLIGLFLGAYGFIAFAVMNTMIVAVFFREVIAATNDLRRQRAIEAERRRRNLTGEFAVTNTLAPLLYDMASFRDREELSSMIYDLFKLIQPLPDEEIGFNELRVQELPPPASPRFPLLPPLSSLPPYLPPRSLSPPLSYHETSEKRGAGRRRRRVI